jgi:hypothetical protein
MRPSPAPYFMAHSRHRNGSFVVHAANTDTQNVTGLGLLPDEPAWEWMVISKLLPLILLCGSVLLVDIKPLLKRLRRPVLAEC